MSGQTLVIVESPRKKGTIAKYLGPGFIVEASVGHIRDLPLNDIGVNPPDFTPRYEPSDGGAAVIKRLKDLVKKSSRVVLATDPDREGEGIAWHLQEALSLGAADRTTFNEITKKVVEDALRPESLRKIDMNLVHAQEARRVIDRLCGYLVSGPLTSVCNAPRPFSAGRVQSPAVRIVVEREREIRNFTSSTHYSSELSMDGDWNMRWQTGPFVPEGAAGVMDSALAQSVADIRSVRVESFEEGPSKSSPPAPFMTSTLQKAASIALGINPKKCMELAQNLFGNGDITYLRTDNPNISDDFFAAVQGYCKKNNLVCVASRRQYKCKDSAQGAHEAIRPTDINKTEAGGSDMERALYRMIRDRALACCLEDAVYDRRAAVFSGRTADGKDVTFRASGKTLRVPGWKALTAKDLANENDEEEAANPLPKMEKGETLTARDGRLLIIKTNPPSRYSVAALVEKLESLGLGRPATFASIMQNIMDKGYVREEKKRLVPTPDGEKIVDVLSPVFSFLDYGFTADIEEQLDKIAMGKGKYLDIVTGTWERLNEELKSLGKANNGVECPGCGAYLTKIRSKRDGNMFWICRNEEAHGGAAAFFPVSADGGVGEKISAADRPRAACPNPSCGGEAFQFRAKESGRLFWACKTCEEAGRNRFYADDNNAPVMPKTEPCPICGKGNCIRAQGKTGFFWHCDNKACDTFFADNGGKMVMPVECPDCHKKTLLGKKKKDSGDPFFVCTACGKFFDDEGGKPVKNVSMPCPSCGQPCECRKNSRDGSHFWVCEKEKIFFNNDGDRPEKTAPCPACGKHACVVRQNKEGRRYFRCLACSGFFEDDAGLPGKAFATKAGGRPKKS